MQKRARKLSRISEGRSTIQSKIYGSELITKDMLGVNLTIYATGL